MNLSRTAWARARAVVVPLLAIASAGCLNRRETFDSVPRTEQEGAASTDGPGKELWERTEANVFSDKVHVITIRMNQGSYESLYSDERANGCGTKNPNAKYAHIRTFTFDDLRLNNVAIRVRGNTSRCIPRLQFSLRFAKEDEVYKKNKQTDDWSLLKYDPDVRDQIDRQSLFGLPSLTLRRSPNDTNAEGDLNTGAMVREFVSSWAVAQTERIKRTTKRDAPVYRVGYAKVIWNLCANDADKICSKRFVQAYNLAEEITPEFFLMRYDDPEPTVIQHNEACGFKAGTGYTFAGGETRQAGNTNRCYDPELVDGKSFKDKDKEKERVAELISGPDGIMTRLAAAKSAADYESIMDVKSVINYLVGASMVGHWDSAIGNFNNDYLYWNRESQRWKFITWDLDNTFDRFAKASLGLGDIRRDPKPLFDPIFRQPDLRQSLVTTMAANLDRLHENEREGPLNEKIIEARDCFVGELNDTRRGRDKAPESRDALETRLDALCEKSRIWVSRRAREADDYVALPRSERLNPDGAGRLFDFRRERYLALRRELESNGIRPSGP